METPPQALAKDLHRPERQTLVWRLAHVLLPLLPLLPPLHLLHPPAFPAPGEEHVVNIPLSAVVPAQ